MPKGPFDNQRKTGIGPFTNYTVRDLFEASKGRFYDPIHWAHVEPKRLYHVTPKEQLLQIAESEELIPAESGGIFTTAAPAEALGEFILLFDAEELIDIGFSPRTYPVFEDDPGGRSYKTNRGYVKLDSYEGCIPEPLWERYKYPNADDRCNLEYPHDIYISPVSSLNLPPYGDVEVNGGPDMQIDKGQTMQQTFVMSPESSISLPDVKGVIYVDENDNEDVAVEVASKLNSKAMSLDKAIGIYPELTMGRPTYNITEAVRNDA